MTPTEPKKGIVVALDGSDAAQGALEVAIELAAASEETLLLVDVWQEYRADFGIPLFELLPDVIEIPRQWAAETLAAAAAKASARGVRTETLSRYGSAAREICAVARALEPRMIVIGSSGLGSFEAAVFRSVSRSVVKHAPCPVLVVPAAGARVGTAPSEGREPAYC